MKPIMNRPFVTHTGRKVALGGLCALALAACSQEEIAGMEGERLDGMKLSAAEREIAEALIEGYKKSANLPVLRSRDYAHAACYAKKVKMPSRFERVHAAYLRAYPDIDDNFYPWFATRGISEEAAYSFWEHVEQGFKDCSIGSLLKKRFGG